tara:strand:- start:1545 stop:2489 length:945 start_codon:yes stop_codon:yes gene_type:complete
MSKNVIVGNGCGVFSAFLNFFSWMSVSDYNDIDVSLHVCNKTHDWNNCLTTPENPYIRSSQFDRSILSKNVLSEIFVHGDYIKMRYDYPEQFIFLEHYPELFHNCLEYYPRDVLKYSGKGGMTQVYQDTNHLELNRKVFNDQWNKLSFRKKFQERVDEEEKLIEGKKVLSVMLRTIYHYVDPSTGKVATEDAAPAFIQGAVKNVRDRMGEYDAVLLTTQNQPYIDAFVKEFGEDCIFTDRPRFEDFNDWRGVGKDTYELTDEKYQKEVEDCLLDVILTSKSDHILGTCSNMFLGALSMNTKNTCELIQEQFWGA